MRTLCFFFLHPVFKYQQQIEKGHGIQQWKGSTKKHNIGDCVKLRLDESEERRTRASYFIFFPYTFL